MGTQPYTQWKHNPSHNRSTTLHTIRAQLYTQREHNSTHNGSKIIHTIGAQPYTQLEHNLTYNGTFAHSSFSSIVHSLLPKDKLFKNIFEFRNFREDFIFAKLNGYKVSQKLNPREYVNTTLPLTDVGKSCTRRQCLTHIRLASFLWDIGKPYIPRSDAAKCGI